MAQITTEHLSFFYPESEHASLSDISLTVESGEFVTVCGASGSGKSTLLRMFKPSLSPHGRVAGAVHYNGQPVTRLSQREECETIGFVQQSPDNQLVTDKVWHELAFGLESLGLDNDTIRRRAAETAAFFGIEAFFEKNVSELSGGQEQLLCLASVMAMQPEILILDEPTAQLDPVAAGEFLSCLRKINRELGVTVIVSEHRLEELFPVSDRVLILEQGRVLANGTPSELCGQMCPDSSAWNFMPSAARIRHSVELKRDDCPLTIAQGRKWLRRYADSHPLKNLYPEEIPPCGETVLSIKDVRFRYEKSSPDILKGLSFEAERGEFIAILGGNGAGKSTLLSLIGGLRQPYRGKLAKQTDRCAALPQNPRSILSGSSVRQSMEEMFEYRGLSAEEKERQINEAAALCGLEALLGRHPFDLSGGEMQRAALAKVLLASPELLLLDEPTKGLDEDFKRRFAQILYSLTESGVTVIMVSHDVEFCSRYPHRCLMMFNGELVASGTPRQFFSTNSFYVTAARRMSKGIIDSAVTAEDVIYCCTGQRQDDHPDKPVRNPLQTQTAERKTQPEKKKLPFWKKLLAAAGALLLIAGICIDTEILSFGELPLWAKVAVIAVPLTMEMLALGGISKKPIDYSQRSRLPKRTVAASAMILLAVPLTIFVGTTYLYDQKFLFISLLVLLEAMLPFFLVFEGRKPQARELVIIAVMCALAVAGRTAFVALPQVKPVIALIIISGVAFGAEAGFMTGAMTMLLSNIYFGQGAWTPWQMFAAGIIGYISGLLFQKGLLRRSRGALCVFGFIMTVMVYGLIMNFSTMVLVRAPMNTASLIAYYAQGLPMDIIHALSTFFILFFAAEPMLEKLDRVKTKYGLLR